MTWLRSANLWADWKIAYADFGSFLDTLTVQGYKKTRPPCEHGT